MPRYFGLLALFATVLMVLNNVFPEAFTANGNPTMRVPWIIIGSCAAITCFFLSVKED